MIVIILYIKYVSIYNCGNVAAPRGISSPALGPAAFASPERIVPPATAAPCWWAASARRGAAVSQAVVDVFLLINLLINQWII